MRTTPLLLKWCMQPLYIRYVCYVLQEWKAWGDYSRVNECRRPKTSNDSRDSLGLGLEISISFCSPTSLGINSFEALCHSPGPYLFR